jgi:hypothetical protein
LNPFQQNPSLRERTSRHLRRSALKPESTPIHVHINNNTLSGSSTVNQTSFPLFRLKRTQSAASISSDGSQDGESLALSDVLGDLHVRFPKLNFPQYEPLLEEHGIFYAESVADFDREFYVTVVGMAEGAVRPFLKGVHAAIKRERKRAKLDDKENGFNRFRVQSVEV